MTPSDLRATDFFLPYWRMGEAVQNLGDYLTVIVRRNILVGPPNRRGIIRIIGSVIDDEIIAKDLASISPGSEPTIVFWGCGLRSPSSIQLEFQEVCEFLALRGPLSAHYLSVPADTPLGDTGLLLPLIHSAPGLSNGRTLCVTHFNDSRDPDVVRKLSGAQDVLSARLPASEVALWEAVDQILNAEFVITGALHAAVVRAAYGLPFAFWASGVDLPFKWGDFAASLHCLGPFAENVEDGRAAYRHIMQPQLKLPPLTPLLLRAPFGVSPQILGRAADWDADLAIRSAGARGPTG